MIVRCLLGMSALLFCSQAYAMTAIGLENGKTIYGYYTKDLPVALQKDECSQYAFASKDYKPLKNGRYKAQTGQVIRVENSCLYPRSGEAILSNGDKIEFYQTDSFNINGEIVYRMKGGNLSRIFRETLRLKNGQEFSVENGHIINYGSFENGRVVYEDRD